MSRDEFVAAASFIILGSFIVLTVPQNIAIPTGLSISMSGYWTLRLIGKIEDRKNE